MTTHPSAPASCHSNALHWDVTAEPAISLHEKSTRTTITTTATTTATATATTTLFPKKRSHFYFLNNSVKNEPILISFCTLNPEGT